VKDIIFEQRIVMSLALIFCLGRQVGRLADEKRRILSHLSTASWFE